MYRADLEKVANVSGPVSVADLSAVFSELQKPQYVNEKDFFTTQSRALLETLFAEGIQADVQRKEYVAIKVKLQYSLQHLKPLF